MEHNVLQYCAVFFILVKHVPYPHKNKNLILPKTIQFQIRTLPKSMMGRLSYLHMDFLNSMMLGRKKRGLSYLQSQLAVFIKFIRVRKIQMMRMSFYHI